MEKEIKLGFIILRKSIFIEIFTQNPFGCWLSKFYCFQLKQARTCTKKLRVTTLIINIQDGYAKCKMCCCW